MSNNNYYNFGTINNDHSKHVTINNAGANVNDIVRSFFAEDVEPVQEEKPTKADLFCRITKEAYEKGVAQRVEDELSSACVSAPKLVKALKTNDSLGYTDTQNLYSSDLYDMLDEHYGLPFKKHAFSVARSK